MEVILLERIARLGQMGEVVRVRDGYARNFLLPQKKALRATDDNRKRFESQRSHLEARNLERRQEAEAVAVKLNGQSFIVVRQAGETGQLYGSVTARDVAELMDAGGFSVSRSQVALNSPIKTIGLHPRGDRASPRGRGKRHRQCRPQRRRGGTPGARRGSVDASGRGRGSSRRTGDGRGGGGRDGTAQPVESARDSGLTVCPHRQARWRAGRVG